MSATLVAQDCRTAAHDLAARRWFVVFVHGVRPDDTGRLVCTCKKWKTCKSPGKHPHMAKGYQDRPRPNAAAIDAHYDRYPLDNVGMLTSGLIGIDLDTPDAAHDWRNGEAEWQALQAEHGPVPATLTAITGSGGRHELYRPPVGREHVSKLPVLPASHYKGVIDVKAKGGLIVVAPSLHKSGNRYEWVDLDVPIATLPDWLYETQEAIAPLFRANPKGKPAPRKVRTARELSALDIAAQELMALRTDPDALLGLETLRLIRESRPGPRQSHVIMSICLGAASVGYDSERLYEQLRAEPGGLGIREAIAQSGHAAGRERFDRAMHTAYLWLAECLDSIGELRAEVDTYYWREITYVGRNGKTQTVRGKTLRRVIIAGLDIAERTTTTAPMIGVERQLPSMTGLSATSCLKAVEALEWLGWWVPENPTVPGTWQGMANAYVYRFNLETDSRAHPPLQVTPGKVLRRHRSPQTLDSDRERESMPIDDFEPLRRYTNLTGAS
jgi:hypothetical protein